MSILQIYTNFNRFMVGENTVVIIILNSFTFIKGLFNYSCGSPDSSQWTQTSSHPAGLPLRSVCSGTQSQNSDWLCLTDSHWPDGGERGGTEPLTSFTFRQQTDIISQRSVVTSQLIMRKCCIKMCGDWQCNGTAHSCLHHRQGHQGTDWLTTSDWLWDILHRTAWEIFDCHSQSPSVGGRPSLVNYSKYQQLNN